MLVSDRYRHAALSSHWDLPADWHNFTQLIVGIDVAAVCVTDKASMIFGGSDAPLALGCMYSLGSINMANNGKIQSGVSDVLEKYGVSESRIYLNFFDMPRENVGWNRATFAGWRICQKNVCLPNKVAELMCGGGTELCNITLGEARSKNKVENEQWDNTLKRKEKR